MRTNDMIKELLNVIPGMADGLVEGACYDKVWKNGAVVGLRKTECNARTRPLTITEVGAGNFNVSTGHLNKFSADGRPAVHIGITAPKQPNIDITVYGNPPRGAPLKIVSERGTGLPGATIHQKAIPASHHQHGTGLEDDPEADDFVGVDTKARKPGELTAAAQRRMAAIDDMTRKMGRPLTPEEIEGLDYAEAIISKRHNSPPEIQGKP